MRNGLHLDKLMAELTCWSQKSASSPANETTVWTIPHPSFLVPSQTEMAIGKLKGQSVLNEETKGGETPNVMIDCDDADDDRAMKGSHMPCKGQEKKLGKESPREEKCVLSAERSRCTVQASKITGCKVEDDDDCRERNVSKTGKHSADDEYAISEDERQQITREAKKFCGDLRTGPRKKKIKEAASSSQSGLQNNNSKGKKKMVDLKTVVSVKQMCGICLSEEGKNTVSGILNCCSHYFCFSCINEWAKVESRCPTCKKRFATIIKTARGGGLIHVPKRDQVYQPSEEEVMGFLDPYENVVCIECHQGGDDALMLLCDLCDSPSHTYCVGLGIEVPEGNWFCNGCRSSTPFLDNGNSSVVVGSSSAVSFDLLNSSSHEDGVNRPFCVEKKQVQKMVKSKLGRLSRKSAIGYLNFKTIARMSTHTILASMGSEHRANQVCQIKTQPLSCHHFAGSCPSCVHRFVKSVVKEITCLILPLDDSI